jgi:transmembrane sensor
VGLLQYDDAPLDQVARDLGRNIGRPVRAEGGSVRMRFTGTLVLQGPPGQVFARAGPLLGVRFVEKGDSWTMIPADAPRR